MRSGRWSRAVGALGAAGLLAACGGSDDQASAGGDDRSDATADIDPDHIGPQDRVAQFVVECTVSHISFDDPIVLPWQPGKSHQHQFFGNTAVTADPSYEPAVGAETSCDQRLDTAAYWSPTLLDASGEVVEAIGMVAYHRPGNGVRPQDVVAYPPGFMMIAGDASATASGIRVATWSCSSGAGREIEPLQCPTDSSLRLEIVFPDCWDGDRLTTFGAGTHVAYSDDGCPESHPVAIPQLQMSIDFPPVVPQGLRFSSGPLASAHADFWNTWDQDKLEREVSLCLNRDLVCGLSS